MWNTEFMVNISFQKFCEIINKRLKWRNVDQTATRSTKIIKTIVLHSIKQEMLCDSTRDYSTYDYDESCSPSKERKTNISNNLAMITGVDIITS